MLERYSEGVIALTGCLQSRFCRRVIEDRPDEARAHADDLLQIFGPENVYFELQVNGIPEQDKANEGIDAGRPRARRAAGRHRRRPLPAARGLRQPRGAALRADEVDAREPEDPLRHQRVLFEGPPRRWTESFAPWPEAVPNTLEIAERCNVEIELGELLLPKFPTPDGSEPEAMLRRLADGGAARAATATRFRPRRVERLEMELGVIEDMGFPSYFLIVWDFVRYAKDNGVAVGPGRGSAAGSIVAYSLGITDLDPLANDLLFERFLNPARRSMPDIDIDFSVRGRERVIRYVGEKYGRESVAQIITFGTMAPRAATRDAARVLGFDYGTGDRVAKLIPEPIMGRSPTFDECLKDGEDLKKAYDAEPDVRQIVETARGLEGIVRNNSIHAAAVVIADRPLQEVVPLQLAEDRGAAKDGERSYKIVTQYSMGPVEEIGLLKMDFLGLRNLDVIEDAVAIIERSRGIDGRRREPAARRRQDLRDARPRRLDRRLPARVRGHARGDAQGQADRVRRHRRARLALPAGRDELDPRLRARQARPRLGPLPGRAPAPDHRGDLRLLHLPGAADGDLQAARRLQRRRGGRPAQGDRQEEARPDGDDGAEVHRRLAASGTDPSVASNLWSLADDLLPLLDAYPKRFLGVVCLLLKMREPILPYYAVNICDPTPVTSVIEAAEAVGTEHTDGLRLVYVPRYCDPDSQTQKDPDDVIYDRFISMVERMAPSFSRDQVVEWTVQRAKLVEPVHPVGLKPRLAPIWPRVEGLALASNAQIYPRVLSGDSVIAFAEDVAGQARDRLGLPR